MAVFSIDLSSMAEITPAQKSLLRRIQDRRDDENKKLHRSYFHLSFKPAKKNVYICFCLKNTKTKKKAFVYFMKNGDIYVEYRECVPNTAEYVNQHYVVYKDTKISVVEAESQNVIDDIVESLYAEALVESAFCKHAQMFGSQLLKTQPFFKKPLGDQLCAGKITSFNVTTDKYILKTSGGGTLTIPSSVTIHISGNPLGQWIVTNSTGSIGIYSEGKFLSRFLPP